MRRRIIFPAGIFLILFLTLAVISTFISLSYFYVNTKESIRKIDKETRNYAESLIDACTNIAELGDFKKRTAKLNRFYMKNRTKELFYKGFFVLDGGKIVAHSDQREASKLAFSIYSDEFSYNSDMIFSPLREDGNTMYFLDYYIIEKFVPFSREEVQFFKKHFYKGIDRNGWLVTKAVVENGKKIGTVNFIITKDKIYSAIKSNMIFVKRMLIFLYIVSAAASLILSIIVLVRYWSIRNRTEKETIEEIEEHHAEPHLPKKPREEKPLPVYEEKPLSKREEPKVPPVYPEPSFNERIDSEILDAIPIPRRSK